MIPKLLTPRLILREMKFNDIFGYYEMRSDKETMQLFGGPMLMNDIEIRDIVERLRSESESGISYFWTIVLKEEREFIGYVRLVSYASDYFFRSFGISAESEYYGELLKYFDRKNGWEMTYALLKDERNKGIMREALPAVLGYCEINNIGPIYAKVNHLTNKPSINVLRRNNFKEYLPIVDNSKLPKEFDESDCFDKEYGMIFIKN
jgi:RimJ/RimL family protein N-acetyltransferase